jgi:hypothetical protein
MKLRFAVDQGACLRRGIDCNSSTITIEVDPPKLHQEDRNLIADRMVSGSIDVGYFNEIGGRCLITAATPDYKGLMEAIRKNEAEIAEPEFASLKLLSDMQAELHGALNALGGKQSDGLLQYYPFYTAGYINRAVEGYVYLRQSRRIEASKHLIRTAIEAIIRIQAVQKQPELLFRIAFTEFNDDKRWVRSLQRADFASVIQAIDDNWAEFVQAYRTKYHDHPLTEQELSLWRAAECAGIEGYYNSHYRLYCRFTHAAFRASTGELNKFEPEDNRTMTLCTLAAVDALVSLGAPAPNLTALKERLRNS